MDVLTKGLGLESYQDPVNILFGRFQNRTMFTGGSKTGSEVEVCT